MRYPLPASLTLALILLAPGLAESQMIDQFSNPVAISGGSLIFSVVSTNPVQILTQDDTSALGDNRGVYGQRSAGTDSVNYQLSFEQQFRVSNNTPSTASAKLLYGFDTLTNGNAAQEEAIEANAFTSLTLPAHSLDTAFDFESAFSFIYQNNGAVTNVRVSIVTGRDEFEADPLNPLNPLPLQFDSDPFVLPQAVSDATFYIPFSSFQGATAATFSDVDQIILSFGLIPANTVFAIDNFTVCPVPVPEPGTWAILGMAGVLGLGAWVRHRRTRSPTACQA